MHRGTRGWRGRRRSKAAPLFRLCGANPLGGMAGPLWPTALSDRREESKVRGAPRTTSRTCSPWRASRGSTSGRARGVGQDSSSISFSLWFWGLSGLFHPTSNQTSLEIIKEIVRDRRPSRCDKRRRRGSEIEICRIQENDATRVRAAILPGNVRVGRCTAVPCDANIAGLSAADHGAERSNEHGL